MAQRGRCRSTDWSELTERMSAQGSLETQELINGYSSISTPAPLKVLKMQWRLKSRWYCLRTWQTSELITLLETQYDWAIDEL